MNDIEPERYNDQSIPWTARDAWIGLAFLFGWLLLFNVGALITILILPIDIDVGLLVTFGEILLLIPVWLLVVRKYRVSWNTLGFRKFSWWMLSIGLGLLITLYIFNFFYGVFLDFFDLDIQENIDDLLLDLPSPWTFVFAGVVVAPIVEEIFFRGFMFTGLRKRYKWYIAALITSFFFAAMHLQLTAFIPLFAMGFMLAFLYHISNSIWLPIIVHATTNALSIGLVFLADRLDITV